MVTIEGFDRALEHLDGLESVPSLVLVDAEERTPELAAFLEDCASRLKSKISPLVVVANEPADWELEKWYRLGANSVVASGDGQLMGHVAETCKYWLVHNRTPKHV